MKKKLLCLLGLAALTLSLGACANKGNQNSGDDNTPVTPVKTKYTVAFEVDGQRVKTLKIEEGATITETIANPVKDGYVFVGWYEGTTLVDLSTYVVTKNVTFTAKFEVDQAPQLSVEDVKEDGKTYYLVMGWWECTDLKDDGSPKLTSNLTPATVRVFYKNLIKYLKVMGATDENIANIQFRNYSSGPVADMGAAVNRDADVDILIGVGNNINSAAGVALHDSDNAYKFHTNMGSPLTDRYVACTSYASALGVETFTWLKETTAGKNAFLRELTNEEIQASLTINLTVTVHGDTDAVTLLDDKDDVITMPTITVPEDKLFKGFALTANGEVVLNVAKDAELKYNDVKGLVAEGATTLDLYPILEDKPQYNEDLMVFVQASSMSSVEAALLEGRFNSTLTNEKVNFSLVTGDATAFTTAVGTYADVLIGSNELLSGFTADTSGALASAGAKHFAGSEVKVMVSNLVVEPHKQLAKALYDFVVAEAIEYNFHYTYWHNNNTWVTAAERATMDAGILANVKAYVGLTGEETLASKYNLSVTPYVATNTKVADLGAETRALRDGKGTDLIIGCGNNVDATEGTTGGMTTIAKKELGEPFVAASGRRVALIHENPLARSVYETYLVPPTINLTVTVHGDTDAVTLLDDKDDVITMPEITVASDKVFKGFALTASGAVVLNVAKDAELKYNDVKDLVAENATTLDLYPIIEDKPVYAEDVMVYLQGDISAAELTLLKNRFNKADKVVNLQVVSGDAAAFTTAVGDYADVLIGSNELLSGFTADTSGALADVGAKHFVSGLKVMVSNLVIDEHKTLAKELYDFLVAPAAEFEFHYTYWHNDHAWVTESEMEAMDAGIVANLKTLFGITGTDTLIDKLNVKVTPVVLDQTTVGALGTATLALRDNAGTDLIIGCGKNVTSSGGVATVCKDTAATSFMAAGRYVALINHNFLAEHIYTSYFGLTIPEA